MQTHVKQGSWQTTKKRRMEIKTPWISGISHAAQNTTTILGCLHFEVVMEILVCYAWLLLNGSNFQNTLKILYRSSYVTGTQDKNSV